MSANAKVPVFTDVAKVVAKRTKAQTAKAEKLVYRPELLGNRSLSGYRADVELQLVGDIVLEMIAALAEANPDHALLKHPVVLDIQKRAMDYAEKQRQSRLAELVRREKRKKDREAALAKLTPEERKVFGFK